MCRTWVPIIGLQSQRLYETSTMLVCQLTRTTLGTKIMYIYVFPCCGFPRCPHLDAASVRCYAFWLLRFFRLCCFLCLFVSGLNHQKEPFSFPKNEGCAVVFLCTMPTQSSEPPWEDTPDGRWMDKNQVIRASPSQEAGEMMWRAFCRAAPKLERDSNGTVVRIFIPRFPENHPPTTQG